MSDDVREAAVQRILARARSEVEAGRRWRAREILQGALRTHPTDTSVLEQYGRTLAELGDMVEAGKYLFLSGQRGAEVDPAIDVFLKRHGRGTLPNLVAQFPKGIRYADLGALPPVVTSDLERLGLPNETRKKRSAAQRAASVDALDVRHSLALIGCALIGIVLVAATVLGLGLILRWIGEVLRA